MINSYYTDTLVGPWHRHPDGGGLVADSAHVSGHTYVGPDATVAGLAHVDGYSRICGHSVVRDSAHVTSALIDGHAVVGGAAHVTSALIDGDAMVDGAANVVRSRIGGHTDVSDYACAIDAEIVGRAPVHGIGHTRVYGFVRVVGPAWTWGEREEPPHEQAVALLDKIRRHVLAHPERLWGRRWNCGRSHSLAGWAQVVSGYPASDDDSAYEEGVQLLGRWGGPMLFRPDEEIRAWLTERSYM